MSVFYDVIYDILCYLMYCFYVILCRLFYEILYDFLWNFTRLFYDILMLLFLGYLCDCFIYCIDIGFVYVIDYVIIFI